MTYFNDLEKIMFVFVSYYYYCNVSILYFFTVLDRVRYHPDDIGCCVPSAHQSSQTLLVNIYIDLLFYIFQHIS